MSATLGSILFIKTSLNADSGEPIRMGGNGKNKNVIQRRLTVSIYKRDCTFRLHSPFYSYAEGLELCAGSNASL